VSAKILNYKIIATLYVGIWILDSLCFDSTRF